MTPETKGRFLHYVNALVPDVRMASVAVEAAEEALVVVVVVSAVVFECVLEIAPGIEVFEAGVVPAVVGSAAVGLDLRSFVS